MADGTKKAGGGDFVSAMAAGADAFGFGVDAPADGEEDEAEGPKGNEAQKACDEENAGEAPAAAGADTVREAIGVDGFFGAHGVRIDGGGRGV